MSIKTETSSKLAAFKQETRVSYEIGKTKVIVTRIFRDDDAQTLDGILVKLMKKEVEKS